MSFVDDFTKRFGDITDAPEMFVRASAYHLLSYFPGRFCHSNFGRNIKANTFIILSCVPGRGRRSTIASWDSDVASKVWKQLCGESGEEDEKSSLRIEEEVIEDGTPEGISDHVMKTKTKILDIRSTEFGQVLEKMSEGGYEYGLASFYSRLYSGERYSQHLSTRKESKNRLIPRGLYCTMFCGMQEPYLYIKPAMIREGLIRRIILCYVPVEKLSHWKPPLDEDIGSRIVETLDWASNQIYEIYTYFLRRNPVFIVFEKDAVEKINKICRDYEDRVRTIPGDLSIYLQSTWEQLIKLSMLEAISRKGVLVTLEDVNKALLFYEPIIKQAECIVNSLSEEKPIVTIRRATDRVYATIATSDKGTITRGVLHRKLHYEASQLDECLKELEVQGKILTIPGRPTKYQTTPPPRGG